jgi:hypothetical protein
VRRSTVGKNKYAPDINFEDVSTYVREHERSTGYRAIIVLVPGRGIGGGDYVEVWLVPSAAPDHTTPTVKTRGPFPTRQIGRQMSALLHTVALAYQELEANPWLWTLDRVRRVTQSEG